MDRRGQRASDPRCGVHVLSSARPRTGLAIGSFALGPVITHRGYAAGFAAGGIAGAVGTLVAALLFWRSLISSSRSAVTASEPVNESETAPSSFNSSPKFRNGQQ